MRYNPENASGALRAGEYDATIKAAKDGVSKSSGREMQTVTFEVYDGTRPVDIDEYYVDGPSLYKYRYLAKALGAERDFKDGRFDASNYIGASIRVELSVEEDADYGGRNRVKKVTAKEGGQPPRRRQETAPPSPSAELTDDDIPF